MIIEYDGKYDKDIINLFIELQRHIADLDREGYNILTDNSPISSCLLVNLD